MACAGTSVGAPQRPPVAKAGRLAASADAAHGSDRRDGDQRGDRPAFARQLMRGRNYSPPRCVAALSITAMLRNTMSLFSFWNVARSFGSAVCATSLLVAPAAGAETLTMCGQTVPYTVVPPAADVPANMRAFSGPWIGTWATGICNAVIIESIQPDGTVSILDVFGPDSGKPAGSLRYAGKIVGNTLSSAGRTNSIEFTQTSATQMSATYLTSNVQARGTFSRP